MDIGSVRHVDIESEMKVAYLDYAMSVIVARALPDARDGLKPVHRRILYAMHDMGIRANAPYKKSARIVGDVLGKYHPHGDSAIYEAMVRMAQDFSMRYPLVNGQGNFGSVDGDSAAAMRYTEARLATIAEEMLLDIDKDTVDWVANFDATLEEPQVLPSRLPNLLLNGAAGIAVGMATNIPPHNLGEVCDAVVYMIDHYDSVDELSVSDLMQFVKGPDFPTGGLIVGRAGIESAYGTGKGRVVMRALARIEEMKGLRHRIVITEIPYMVNKANLIEKIADLVRAEKLKEISDLRDESDRRGMSIVIELKRGAQPNKVLNRLYKFTTLQSTFGVNMLALIDGEPRVLSLKRMLLAHIEHRRQVIARRTQYELDRAKHRAHILEGLRIALANLDEVIRTIRESESADHAKEQLMARFGLTDIQAQAILDMQLRRLAALERQKIEDEYNEVLLTISHLEDLLANPHKILNLVKEDALELKEKYGDKRRTQILVDATEQIDEEDLIGREEVLVSITQYGYIKRVPTTTYKAQLRGGKGITGMATREEDAVQFLFAANTLDTILYFTDRGKVYSEKVYRAPDSARTAKGIPLVNLINLAADESVTAIVVVPSFDTAEYLTMVTRKGKIKRVDLSAFASVRPSGLIAIVLTEDDELGWVKMTRGNCEIIVVTEAGQAIRFAEASVRVMGRATAGVRAVDLAEGDQVAGVEVVTATPSDLLLVTSNGFAKRTPVADYRLQARAGKGVRTLSRTGSIVSGPIVSVRSVADEDEIAIISAEGMVMRTQVKHIPRLGRTARGIILMRMKEKDLVAAVALLTPQEANPCPAPETGTASASAESATPAE